MRIIFASTAFSQAAELSSFFADVEIVAVCNSFTDLLRVLREEREAYDSGHREAVDAILLAENLDHKMDREGDGGEPLTLMRTIEQIRLIGPAELILVVNFSSTTLPDEDLRRFNIRPVIGDQVRIEGSPIQRYLDLRKIEGVSSIIVFAGLKGGVGRTTLALNYAASCVKDETRSSEEQVLLWDMDFHASTLRAILPDNAPLDLGIDDALNSASLEWEDIRRYIYPASQSRLGFDILFAPEGVRDTIAFFQTNAGVRLLASKIARILNEARLRYRTIVCDLGTDLFMSPLPALALNQASFIAYIIDASRGGWRSFEHAAEIFEPMGWIGKTGLVINRATTRDQLKNIDPSKLLGVTPLGAIRSNSEIFARAERDGELLLQNRNEASDDMRALFTRISELAASGAHR